MHRVSVAPMMDRTDRHFRYFLRQVSPGALLYTEMITADAIRFGDRQRLLDFHPAEHPVALQLGGDDPAALAEAARMGADHGYDEINLNVGCPSDRVQQRRFGACLMGFPDVVAECVEAMARAVPVPVTVKHRIGIDDLDTYEHMERFVRQVASAGCRHFTVHARKAWLQGLSPKENRTIPPLRHEDVYRLKQAMPELFIETNGGVRGVQEVHDHLRHVDAVMIGRAAVDDPWLFAEIEREVMGGTPPATREDVAHAMVPYLDEVTAAGEPAHRVTRHMLNLFAGRPGARAWKRHLTEHGRAVSGQVIVDALDRMDRVRNKEVA